MTTVSPGSKIGRFEIERELGRGGMGAVYLAKDPVLGRKVAIKTIVASDFETADRDELLRRLLDEGRAAANLRHPGIVTVLDAIQQGDETWIVMEHVAGTKLSDLLKNRQSPASTLRILREIADALDYAHDQKIVHRDIKPDNILLEGGDKVRIVDFGIAKSLSKHSIRSSGTLGTPHYMPPEQLMNEPMITGNADQFSLGVIAYFMLTGNKPFDGPSLIAIADSIKNQDPLPASQIEKSLPPAVDKVVQRALEKDPQDRYPNCMAFVLDLERALGGAVPARPKGAAMPRWALWSAAALLLLAIGGLGAWLWPRPDPSFALAVYSGGSPIAEGQHLTLDPAAGAGGFSAAVTADRAVPSANHVEVSLAGSDGLVVDRGELHGDKSGMKHSFNGTLAPGEYFVRLSMDGATRKELHFSVEAPAPPTAPPPPAWKLEVRVLNNVAEDGQKFNKQDPEYPRHGKAEKIGKIGQGDITASIIADPPLPPGTPVKLMWLKDGVSVQEAAALPLDALGKPQALTVDPGPGDYTAQVSAGGQQQEIHFTIVPTYRPPAAAPVIAQRLSPQALGLELFSRVTRLSPGQQFGYNDPDLGQLDGKELIARVSAGGNLPSGTKVEIEWLVNGQPTSGTEEVDLRSTQGGVRLRYPNPIPLPGEYTVRLLVNGAKLKEFSFKINQ
jgi:tRNA A-37 threonylcarbamoyl transferase component Bud32